MNVLHRIDAERATSQLLIQHRVIHLTAVDKFSCRACPDREWPDYDGFAGHLAELIVGQFDLVRRSADGVRP